MKIHSICNTVTISSCKDNIGPKVSLYIIVAVLEWLCLLLCSLYNKI